MEKTQEDIVKYHQEKRRKHKIKLAEISIICIIISLALVGIYYVLSKNNIINYKETSDITYGVNIKENEFYEKTYLEEGMDIIASLIQNIDAEFKYDLALTEEIPLEYDYKILAEVEVKEKSKSNLIYEKQYELINKSKKEIKSNKLNISEKINIDYNKYNAEIEKMIDTYDLRNTTSEVNIVLYLNVINQHNGENINKDKKVAVLSIPLTTNTVEITVNENIKNNYGEIAEARMQNKVLNYIFIIGLLMFVLAVIILIRLASYVSETRSAEKMYDDELKKILFDYKSYIQKINNILDYNDYKIVNVDTFKELIGMREELQSPILMYTEKDRRRTTFLMINQNLLFQYVLDSDLIRKRLIEMSKEKKEKENEKNK